jgi:hypothetical protein
MSQDRGAFLSSDLSGLKVRVVCLKCEQRRQYDGNALIARVGRDVPLPELLTRIAVGLGCDLNIAPTPNGLRCAMRYEYPTGWDLAGLR